MNFLDILIPLFILIVAIIQAIRGKNGMGRILFEMIAFIMALVIANRYKEGISTLLKLDISLTFLITFIVLLIIFIYLAYLLFNITEWSLGNLDSFFSFIFGIAIGWVLCFSVIKFLYLKYTENSEIGFLLSSSKMANEIYYFKTYNKILELLHKARLGPQIEEIQN
ncbi:MAG: CvpA family protein [candidate division WOR-3 bacterium]|nr:CvpA family protein [candidate division WOR-3 bacterium]MDW8113794.1 CvpA family protein [candidate division WOR-3 bacterium]